MKTIIAKTDEEILAFLQQNNEEYAASTEAAQQDMVNSWNEMLMDMHGTIENYWDEVEEIIAGGDDAIIAFLKENSADYKEAGKLQAEAYVDEWKEQLEALRKAHKEITEEINNTEYKTVSKYTGSSSSSSSSSSGSSGGSSSTINGYKVTVSGNGQNNTFSFDVSQWGSAEEAKATANAYISQLKSQHPEYKITGPTKYAEGGMADFTGLAWLDGTKTKPERILSAYQTELFEDLLSTLHGIKVFANSMPSVGYDNTNSGQTFTFGDIVINVDKLDSDADYQAVAEQVMEQIMDSVTRGSAVGGIRITR